MAEAFSFMFNPPPVKRSSLLWAVVCLIVDFPLRFGLVSNSVFTFGPGWPHILTNTPPPVDGVTLWVCLFKLVRRRRNVADEEGKITPRK